MTKVGFYWDQPFSVGWVFWCTIRKKTFSVGLVNQLFQPPSKWVETVEKALAATAVIYAGHLKSATGSCCVAFPQLANAEKSGNSYMYSVFTAVTAFQPKTVGNVFYVETSTASTQSGCV